MLQSVCYIYYPFLLLQLKQKKGYMVVRKRFYGQTKDSTLDRLCLKTQQQNHGSFTDIIRIKLRIRHAGKDKKAVSILAAILDYNLSV